jgi:tungstate transport system ATP-binding protein
MKPLIEIRDLLIKRGNTVVLEIDHLEITPNIVTALVGPNGAGKTTLLNALARLIKPTRGQILFDGRLMDDIPAIEYRRKIGLVMQDSFLLDLSVFDNIALGLRFRRTPKVEITSRVEKILERLNISSLRSRNAIHLSGGEAQRVSLARALVLEPQLLLLDEPFISLDEKSHGSLLTDLKILLPQTQTTTILATHASRDIHELSNNQIPMMNGKTCV